MSADLHARLSSWLDKAEITECIVKLARGMDRHDIELAKSSFWPEGQDDHATLIGTATGMIDWADNLHDEGFRAHQHLLTNIHVDLDGDEALTCPGFPGLLMCVDHAAFSAAV